tara:strand:- start:58723 stop:59223 length:501 start_codon:yes stop_codon:yes gene_type:complete
MKNLVLCSLLLFLGCAQKTVKKSPPSYSNSTESEFENIENERARVLEYYRELRKRNWKNYTQKSRGKTRRFKRIVPRSAPSKKTKSTRKKVVKKAPPTPWPEKKIQDVQIEIAQHLTFYCMEQRKNPKFKKKGSCKEFTNQLYDKCYEKNSPIRSRNIIRCVKRGI